MSNPQRWRRNRRNAGLAQLGKWTRRAVAAGVVFSGVLAAGLAHLLPGQAAAVEHRAPHPTSPAATPETSETSETSETPRTTKTRRTRRAPRRLAPPIAPPRPTPDQTHVTSGGS